MVDGGGYKNKSVKVFGGMGGRYYLCGIIQR